MILNYNEATDFIMSHRKFQKTGGHERIEKLLYLLGSPHKKLKFVHIVGTNGKGSTSTAMACILKEAGYRTGLFTSPYVVEFGERIQVDGEYIPKEEIVNICELIKEKTELLQSEDMYPTVFEVTTALAMVYFERRRCDIVFLEAGIGGEHDSTNIIPSPLAAVFTAISLDHTEMLGDTTEKIAREKSGIIKKGTTVVSYPLNGECLGFTSQDKNAAEVIRTTAENMGCPFVSADCKKAEIKSDTLIGIHFTYEGLSIKAKVTGRFQVGNLLTAIETVKVLREKGFTVTDSHIEKGIESFTMVARTEIIREEPLVILDGGHNEASVSALKETVKKYLPSKKITFLLSFMKDKDYETCIKNLSEVCNTMVFTNVDKVRGESSETLSLAAKAYCEKVLFNDDPQKAYETALKATEKDGALIVAGSFYLASFIRAKEKN